MLTQKNIGLLTQCIKFSICVIIISACHDKERKITVANMYLHCYIWVCRFSLLSLQQLFSLWFGVILSYHASHVKFIALTLSTSVSLTYTDWKSLQSKKKYIYIWFIEIVCDSPLRRPIWRTCSAVVLNHGCTFTLYPHEANTALISSLLSLAQSLTHTLAHAEIHIQDNKQGQC